MRAIESGAVRVPKMIMADGERLRRVGLEIVLLLR